MKTKKNSKNSIAVSSKIERPLHS